MKIALTGVLEDGSERDAGVPLNARVALSVPQGADVEIAVAIVRADGTPVAPDSAVLTVRKRPATDAERTFYKAGIVAAEVTTFTLVPADTKDLPPGLYAYDVWVVISGKRDPVIPTSPFHLEPSVTFP